MKKIDNGKFEIEGRIVQLVDGVFNDPTNSLSIILNKDTIINGELTNKGDKGCVVELAYNTGGMGTFYVVVVLREIKGEYQQIFSVDAGSNYEERTFELMENKVVRIAIQYRDEPEQFINCALSQLLI